MVCYKIVRNLNICKDLKFTTRNLRDVNCVWHFSEQLKFNPIPVNANLELGSTSQISCRADGRVAPSIEWSRSGDTTDILQATAFDANVRDVNGTLFFDDVRLGNAGDYTCTATSEQGVIIVTITVDVVGTFWSLN